MEKTNLKRVYIPINEETQIAVVSYPKNNYIEGVIERKLITFTQKEYNQHIKDIIKDTLDEATKKANIFGETFEETFNKWKV